MKQVWVWVRGEYLYTRYPSHTRVLKLRKSHTHTQTQSKQGKSVKLGLVRAVNHGYEFCCHAYSYLNSFKKKLGIWIDIWIIIGPNDLDLRFKFCLVLILKFEFKILNVQSWSKVLDVARKNALTCSQLHTLTQSVNQAGMVLLVLISQLII